MDENQQFKVSELLQYCKMISSVKLAALVAGRISGQLVQVFFLGSLHAQCWNWMMHLQSMVRRRELHL